jgi:hypothetical protein
MVSRASPPQDSTTKGMSSALWRLAMAAQFVRFSPSSRRLHLLCFAVASLPLRFSQPFSASLFEGGKHGEGARLQMYVRERQIYHDLG